jgi:putative transposase/transposase-like zinc-binding protein
VLRVHAAEYLARRGAKASLAERRVLAQLITCRTARMGGHAWKCDSCGAVQAAYDSCRNRHCPTCRGAARAKWLDRVREDLLPVPYFHVIQTLPHEPHLDRLVLANRRLLFALLFRTTAETLLQLAADPRHLGGRIGLLIVLHTWGQLMNRHTHVHVVVPGGGLSPDGTRWVSCREGFFLPVEVMGALFRGKFLAGLKRLWREGKLKLDPAARGSQLAEPRQFESWLSTLYNKNWVAYAQGPPSGVTGPEAVLKYLARYVSGVAISDKRLVSHVNGRVTFRWKNYRDLKKGTPSFSQGRGGREGTTSLPGVEFVQRYMQHVLPRGLVRIRYYGLLSNRRRREQLARCREFLGASTSPAAADSVTRSEPPILQIHRPESSEPPVCPSCGRGRLVLTETWPRVTGWPWQSRVCEAVVAKPRMPNTFEEFLGRRRSQPSRRPKREGLPRDTS